MAKGKQTLRVDRRFLTDGTAQAALIAKVPSPSLPRLGCLFAYSAQSARPHF
jgi:hypothetical protein